MTALALIEEARADGLGLRSNGLNLKLSGRAEVIARWKPRIVASKPEVLAALLQAPQSTWWLLHFSDRAPIVVWTSPPACHAELLARHPDAAAAQMIQLQRNQGRLSACATCTHATYRGGCDDPVAAGLWPQNGGIRYHANGGANCPAWLERIQPDLEGRILAMAARWNYTDDDLAAVLAGARADPGGWGKLAVT
jgi:hypothetical protein